MDGRLDPGNVELEGARSCTSRDWTVYGGTGKLRGLTGKGTCTGTFDANGAAVFEVGEYAIAAAKTR